MTGEPQSIPAEWAQVVDRVVAVLVDMPHVVGVSLGGSTGTGLADASSDLDLHVYWRPPLMTPEERASRLSQIGDVGSVRVDVRSWGLEDHVGVSGRLVELIYQHFDDLWGHVEQAYTSALQDEGYTTAQLHSVANGRLLYDPSGTLLALRKRLHTEFPEATRQHLLRYHPALLRMYVNHIGRAQGRGDLLFVQHRRYTVQMLFFNLLFALNRIYHPGEKRLVQHLQRCVLQPHDCTARWLHTTTLAANDSALADALGQLVADLTTLIEQDGSVEVADYLY